MSKTKLKRALAYIGDHSFSIMALNFLAFKVVNFAQIEFYGYNIGHLAEFPVIDYGNSWGWSLAYMTIGVAIPSMLAYAYNKIKR